MPFATVKYTNFSIWPQTLQLFSYPILDTVYPLLIIDWSFIWIYSLVPPEQSYKFELKPADLYWHDRRVFTKLCGSCYAFWLLVSAIYGLFRRLRLFFTSYYSRCLPLIWVGWFAEWERTVAEVCYFEYWFDWYCWVSYWSSKNKKSQHRAEFLIETYNHLTNLNKKITPSSQLLHKM